MWSSDVICHFAAFFELSFKNWAIMEYSTSLPNIYVVDNNVFKKAIGIGSVIDHIFKFRSKMLYNDAWQYSVIDQIFETHHINNYVQWLIKFSNSAHKILQNNITILHNIKISSKNAAGWCTIFLYYIIGQIFKFSSNSATEWCITHHTLCNRLHFQTKLKIFLEWHN